MINQDVFKGKWTQFKGEVQKTWGKITGDEHEKTKDDLKSITGLLRERYGLAKEEADKRLDEVKARFVESTDDTTETIKQKVANTTEKVKESLDKSNKKQQLY